MSLFIEVYVGSRDDRVKVAESKAWNVSDLAKVSDYEFRSEEFGAPHLDIPAKTVEGNLYSHRRDQSVWALVEKIAKDSV